MKLSSGYEEKRVWNEMLCEEIYVTLSVIINLGSTILRRCGHGEWRVQESFVSVTEKCSEIITARNNRNNVAYR
jgi:hypothetical protein